MGGTVDTGGGPKTMMMLTIGFGAGLVFGFLVCHFHICHRLGICEASVAVEQHPGPVDTGPR